MQLLLKLLLLLLLLPPPPFSPHSDAATQLLPQPLLQLPAAAGRAAASPQAPLWSCPACQANAKPLLTLPPPPPPLLLLLPHRRLLLLLLPLPCRLQRERVRTERAP
jgi:hypothetical protein